MHLSKTDFRIHSSFPFPLVKRIGVCHHSAAVFTMKPHTKNHSNPEKQKKNYIYLPEGLLKLVEEQKLN